MIKTIQFPIKGTFYYAASIALDNDLIQPKSLLRLVTEPDNEYDKHAIQLWLPTVSSNNQHTHGLLLGYVPRALAAYFFQHRINLSSLNPHVIHRVIKGRTIEIDCHIKLNLSWPRYLYLRLLTLFIRQTHRIQIIRRYFKR